MTPEELLTLARRLIDQRLVSSISEPHQLATGVIDLLSPASPCGFERPEVIRQRGHGSEDLVRVPASWSADVYAEDAEAMGRMLFHAAARARENAP